MPPFLMIERLIIHRGIAICDREKAFGPHFLRFALCEIYITEP